MPTSIIKKNFRILLIIYAIAWAGVLLYILVRLWGLETPMSEVLSILYNVLSNTVFLIFLHVVYAVLLLLFYLFRYFFRLYKKRGAVVFLNQFSYRLLLPLGVLFIGFKTLVFANSNEDFDFKWESVYMNHSGVSKNLYQTDGKQRGMSVFGWNGSDNSKAIDSLIKTHVEWVAVIPFIYQETETAKTIAQRDSNTWTRRDSVFIKTIRQLHDSGLYAQLKPHVWTGSGWRANLNPGSAEDWERWFDSYEVRMLHYAKMAQMTQAELFCIGTELKTSIKAQPQRWKELIVKVRKVYSGKITYAANWHDEYEYIDFWEQLDFIGIQAYFPLTKTKLPSLEQIEEGWQPHITKLEELHHRFKKPVLFTEVGYRSDVTSTVKPWEWGSYLSILSKKKSEKTQQLAYEALFKQLWQKEWFAGSYIWQWDTRTKREDTYDDLDFSPRFKPAENTLAKWYGTTIEKD